MDEQQNKQIKPKKPLYKKWWFWVLLILFIIFVLPVILGIIISIIYESSGDSSSAPKLSRSAKIAKNNWKNNKIEFKDASFKIEKIRKAKWYESDDDGFGKFVGSGAFFVGTFTNKSDKNINLEHYWDKHINVRSYDANGYWNLAPVTYVVRNNDGEEEYARADITIAPGDSKKVAINNVGNRGKNIPNNFRVRILNDKGKKIWMTDFAKYKVTDIQ